MHAYLFEVMYDEDGPAVKYGMDVSDCVSEEYAQAVSTARAAKMAAHKLTGQAPVGMMRKAINPIIERDGLGDKLSKAYPLFMRASITTTPLYIIKTEDPMTFEEIDTLMRNLQLEGKLRPFLEKAKVA